MSKRVLAPVDDSEQSTKALEFACEQFPDAEIIAIHVRSTDALHEPVGVAGGPLADYEKLEKRFRDRSDRCLEKAQEVATEHGREIETAVVDGSPARAIVEYAGENDIDQVVIGSHGRTGTNRILIGSVAEKVVRRSSVPVTVVR